MTLKECYESIGNYDEVIGRLRSERLVQKFTLRFLDDGSLKLLQDSLKAEDYQEAFRAAHTIKGICQNLSFDKLLASSSALAEELRGGSFSQEAAGLVDQVILDYGQTVSVIQKFKDSLE